MYGYSALMSDELKEEKGLTAKVNASHAIRSLAPSLIDQTQQRDAHAMFMVAMLTVWWYLANQSVSQTGLVDPNAPSS